MYVLRKAFSRSILLLSIAGLAFSGCDTTPDPPITSDAGAGSDARLADASSDGARPGTDAGDGADVSANPDSGGTDSGEPSECSARAAAVEFRAMPPSGETKLVGLGACADELTGGELYSYYCVWCHSTLDNNDLQDRTRERVTWAVDLGESVNNWPVGELSTRDAAIDKLLETLLAAPASVTDMHPHPLPEYL